jgi:hypothetical protein
MTSTVSRGCRASRYWPQPAVTSFDPTLLDLLQFLEGCSSGKEKQVREEAGDIPLAGALDVSTGVPVLRDGAYQTMEDYQ